MKEILLNDLPSLVRNKSAVSECARRDRWQSVAYRTAEVSGRMLLAGEEMFPDAVELEPGVRGWHRVYVCLAGIGGQSKVEISLSGGRYKTTLRPSHTECVGGYWAWAAYEWAEEALFVTADLTGASLFINKPKAIEAPFTSAILFVRLVPMTDAEVKEYLRSGAGNSIFYHFDDDYYSQCDYASAQEYAGRVQMLEHGSGCALVNEISFDTCDPDYDEEMPSYVVSHKINRAYAKYLRSQWEVKRAVADAAHALGMEAYAGCRMEMGDFFLPYTESVYNDGLVDLFPQYRCKTRTGEEIAALSYAYPQVRAMAVDKLLNGMGDLFDGVSLFFHRGVHAAFEKAVADRVKELYGTDAARLPFADGRLHGVLCGFMTQFLRELRAALDARSPQKRIKINAVVYFDVQSSKYFGCDVETWAKEGLIDSVSQGLMKHYEVLDGCLGADGLIDLQKYAEKKGKEPVLRRYYGDDEQTVVSGLHDFMRIAERYDIEFFAALPWENKPYEYHLALAKALYEAGACKFICWNANHIAERLPVLAAVKRAGEKEKLFGEQPPLRRLHRVLAVGGRDISEFNPNWRG